MRLEQDGTWQDQNNEGKNRDQAESRDEQERVTERAQRAPR